MVGLDVKMQQLYSRYFLKVLKNTIQLSKQPIVRRKIPNIDANIYTFRQLIILVGDAHHSKEGGVQIR